MHTKIKRPRLDVFKQQVERVKVNKQLTAWQRLCWVDGCEIALVVGWTSYDADIPRTPYYDGTDSVAAKIGILGACSGMSEYDVDWLQPVNDLSERYEPLGLEPGEVYPTEYNIASQADIEDAYRFALKAFRDNKEAIIKLVELCQGEKD